MSGPVEMLKIDSCQERQASILFSFLLTFSLRVAGLQFCDLLSFVAQAQPDEIGGGRVIR